MLHACAARFDVTENLENFLDFRCTKHGLDMIEEWSRCGARRLVLVKGPASRGRQLHMEARATKEHAYGWPWPVAFSVSCAVM